MLHDFITSVWPWIAIGLAMAILAAHWVQKSDEEPTYAIHLGDNLGVERVNNSPLR